MTVAAVTALAAGALDAYAARGAPALVSAPAAPTPVAVVITSSTCTASPSRVPAGAVRFSIANRTRRTQRFAFAGRTTRAIAAGRRATIDVTVPEPGVHGFRCFPASGAGRRGSLQVLRSVVIETDMAADDVMAILYLLGQRDVDVRAIAVDGVGEARCPVGARHALSLVALAGKPGLPVACGRPVPLDGARTFPTSWRDFVDGFFGLPLPAEPVGTAASSAELLLTTAIESAPGPVDVITLGPPTELAAAVRAAPALAQRIRAVTMMGGAVGVPGNANPYAEWNFYIDPWAVNVVLRAGAPVTIVPLDASRFVPLHAGVAAQLGISPTAQFLQRLLNVLLPFAGYQFWDPLAAVVAVRPDVATYETKRLSAVEGESPEAGRLVETADARPVRVAVAADRTRFESLFVSAFG